MKHHISKPLHDLTGNLAVEIEPMLAEEAKKRKLATLKQNATDVANLPPRSKGKSRDQAGDMVGVSGRYVSDAKL